MTYVKLDYVELMTKSVINHFFYFYVDYFPTGVYLGVLHYNSSNIKSQQ